MKDSLFFNHNLAPSGFCVPAAVDRRSGARQTPDPVRSRNSHGRSLERLGASSSNAMSMRFISPAAIRACRGTPRPWLSPSPAMRYRRSSDPDFIPVLGYLDDVIIVSLGIMLVSADPPGDHGRAPRFGSGSAGATLKPYHGRVIVCIWIVSAALIGWLSYRYWGIETFDDKKQKQPAQYSVSLYRQLSAFYHGRSDLEQDRARPVSRLQRGQ